MGTDAVRQYPRMRLLRQDRWECMVSYLCSNTNSLPRIPRCVEKIAGLSPRVVRLDNEVRHVFPSAQELASTGRYSIRDLRLGLNRASNIFSLARELDRDPHMLHRLARDEVANADAVRDLDRRRGAGPKIGNCVALMSPDKRDSFPVDRWVQRALSQCDLSSMSRGREDLAQKVTQLATLTESRQYPCCR